ncbi:hypothetical protein JHK82_015326 [Glycine max]|uniref:DUF4283 domain-containing protein n=1 Tax=Glycine max TaxID=3847 RepID=K7KV51_SOYBN|nr:hypothetical protein JHK85_015709 [Glycine max]KAG5045946.1 hypothetical protein JHK86_015352 [Glycine max]KAG5148445.1 hypothetical protein JHK82_015326 [Glycine max]
MKEVVGCCQRFSWRIVCSRKYVTGEKHWLQSDKRQVNKDFEITGGGFSIMDVHNRLFMAGFDLVEDRKKVMNRRSWMIFDHYLVVTQ